MTSSQPGHGVEHEARRGTTGARGKLIGHGERDDRPPVLAGVVAGLELLLDVVACSWR